MLRLFLFIKVDTVNQGKTLKNRFETMTWLGEMAKEGWSKRSSQGGLFEDTQYCYGNFLNNWNS